MENEEWRSIPSLPQYEASSLGRVRRSVFYSTMPHGGFRKYGGHEWFGVWSPKDRRFILVFKGKTYKIARLVCEAFNGPSPPGMPDVMHDDENSRNNRPENLKWGNQKLNLNYPGFKRTASESRRGCRLQILSDYEVSLLKRACLNGAVYAQVARDFGVSACYVSNVMAGRARSKVDPAPKMETNT